MFHSAAIKLTTWYLAIMMALSLVFSLSIYEVSKEDLGRNVNRQVGYFSDFLAPDQSLNYQRLRNFQLTQDLRHLKNKLILFNILVLVSGGAVSYWLARRTLEPIEEALDSQTRFASDASHELRTPLTAIITENEVALRNKNLTKTSAVSIIKSNLEEAIKLKALAEGLLRLSSGNGANNGSNQVSIKTIAADVISRHQAAADAKKIKLSDRVSDYKIMGDAVSLTELFSVFIDNAIKYTPIGGSVKISSSRQHRTVAIKISDNGPGIKADDLPRIFERFFQADSSRHKNSPGGYGLGLSIAKKIVEAHHGHIEVKSTVGKGTVFTIFLPAA